MSQDPTSPETPTAPSTDSELAKPQRRTTLTRTIPTDRVTFPRQCEIIRAHAAAYEAEGAPVVVEALTKFADMTPGTISMGNAFLLDVGIIRKEGRKFLPSDELMAMHRMYGIDESRAWSKLAPLFERSWFGQRLIPLLKFKPMTEDEAVHELAEVSTAEAGHLPQLRVIVEYLILVGLIVRQGGQLKLKNPTTTSEPSPSIQQPQGDAPKTGNGEPAAFDNPPAILLLDPKGKRRVLVQAPPTVTQKELDRIKNWLAVQLIVEEDAQTDLPR
ncbi:MAG: hypothetical protein KF833_02385 [Verrucomicrobiae bacterium]|nr:hypothetical protein [Verrucomicrobiae bacterium]